MHRSILAAIVLLPVCAGCCLLDIIDFDSRTPDQKAHEEKVQFEAQRHNEEVAERQRRPSAL